MKNSPGISVRQHLTVQKQNGIAERAVRRIKEGTSVVLSQSGLGSKMVGGFRGVLLLFAKHTRSLV